MNPGGLLPGENFGFSQQSLNQDVAKVAQFGAPQEVPTASSPFWQKTASPPSQGFLDSFFGKVGSVFGEGAHLIESAAKFTGRTIAEGVMAVPHFFEGPAHLSQDMYNTNMATMHTQFLSNQVNQVMSDYKNGRIDKSMYTSIMNDLSKQLQDNSKTLGNIITKIAADKQNFTNATVGTIADIITVATAGLTSPLALGVEKGATDAGTFLLSRAANDMMAPAEEALTKLANSKALMDALPSYIQDNVKASITDTALRVGAGMTSKDVLRASAINMAVKYPLAFNWLSGTGNQIAKELQNNKYGDAVKTLGFNMGLLFVGGPVGDAVLKMGPAAMRNLSGRLTGTTSFIDNLGHQLFGDSSAIYNAISDNPELVKVFQALEATNVQATDGRVMSAVDRVVSGLRETNTPDFAQTGMSVKDYIQKYMVDWHTAQSALHQELIRNGLPEATIRKWVVGRWTTFDKNRVIAGIVNGKTEEAQASPFIPAVEHAAPDNPDGWLQNWDSLKAANPNASWANNSTLGNQITHILKTSENAAEINDRISNIKAGMGGVTKEVPGFSKSVAEKLASLGYTVVAPSNLEAPFTQGAQKLVTQFAAPKSDFFQMALKPLPVASSLVSYMTHVGLSPVRAEQSVSELFNHNFLSALQETSLFTAKSKYSKSEALNWAQGMYHTLTDYVNETNKVKVNLTHPPITDLRQMTVKEIQDAFGSGKNAIVITKAQAQEVQAALMQSMLNLSWAERGMGDKLVDIVNAHTGTLAQKYLRVQGAGRFAWNPFFKMKVGYKTEFLAQTETGGKVPTILGTNRLLKVVFPKYYNNLASVDSMLASKGLYGGGLTNEAANEVGAGVSELNSAVRGLTKSQRYSVAGLVSSMAEKAGMGAQDYINNFPNEVRDTVASVIHYDPRANFLNSSLARTLNMAIFPFRFNVKVGTFMGRVLARQDWMTRTAVLAGIMDAHNFLTSQQGQIWYAQNSDVIGLLEYFSPVAELKTVAALGNIKDNSIGSFGELGGLPVGFIPQILQAEGLWSPSGAYLNPKTGQAGTNYIPLTVKAKLATAVSSFIGSLFTYPGTEAGLPSKSGNLSKAAAGLTGAKSTDWEKVPMGGLTPQQQQYQQVIQSLQASKQQPMTTPPPTGSVITVPSTGNSTAAPKYKNGVAPTKKLKKSQEPVYLLPGQTQLGQVP